ncbi:hypothetical protein KI387_036355, partial [Taxus chinensis]
RRVVRDRGVASAPRPSLLWITVGPAHSRDDPIDVDSKSEGFTRRETEEDTEETKTGVGGTCEEDDSDSEWHDTHDILRAEREKQSVDR